MRLSHVLIPTLTFAALITPPGRALAAQADSGSGNGRHLERHEDEADHIMRVVMNRRARLGIKVNLQARDTDSLGAYVESVTPNGPAAKAGLRSGDIITKLGGQSVLTGAEADQDTRAHQSMAGLRLIELAARLQPADTVPIEFLRGKDRKTVSVITEKEPEMGEDYGGRPFTMRFLRPGMDRDHMPLPAGDFMDIGPGDRFEFLAGSPLGDLELAPLNSDLGQYFGTTDGVLVIRASKDTSLGLKGGDVVQAVDGRKPASPTHLMRILRSYERGETFKLDILRNRKRQTVTAKLGERDG
jgi:S1-C subfamily serine protease